MSSIWLPSWKRRQARADERPRVAAVYLNRLKKRMHLDADPTIIYGASDGQGNPGPPHIAQRA